MKRQRITYKFGDCPGCHAQGVKLHPTFDSPEPICLDCAWKIQRAERWGANAEHIRREMRLVGMPIYDIGDPHKGGDITYRSHIKLWDDEEERKCRNARQIRP